MPEQQPPEPTVRDLAGALSQELQQLRAQMSREIASVRQQVAQPPPQQQGPQLPKPTASDFEVMRERYLDELGRNPMRVHAELQNAAVVAATEKAVATVEERLAMRDAAARAEQYKNWVIQNNPDIAANWAQVENYVGWAHQNRPDLNFDQQVALAVQATREQKVREFENWRAWQDQESQARAAASLPTSGAYGMPNREPLPASDLEARRQRLELMTGARMNAMRGAYKYGAGSAKAM